MIQVINLIFFILFLGVFYYNFFVIIPYPLLIGIYPYSLAITFILAIILFLSKLTQNYVLSKIFYYGLIIGLVFIVFTFIQIWRNAMLLNHYQKERSDYLDNLMKITKEIEYQHIEMYPQQKGIANLIEANTGIPLTYYNSAFLLNDSQKIFDEMIEALYQAEKHIHIEFFIVKEDKVGKKFKEALLKKAQEGLTIRFIYDGLGSRSLKKDFIIELKEAGVEIISHDNVFLSLLKGKLNHRNHRKIMVIDGKTAFTGGINLADEYLGRNKAIGNWEDIGFKIKGEAVHWLQKVFLADWYYITGEKILDKDLFPDINIKETLPIQIVTSGYDTHWNEISQVYFTMITLAQKKLYIATPYLVLSDSILKALETAALRGVDVKIIVPRKPDVCVVGWANASFFEKLLKSNVEIYQYDEGFLHAKAVVADEKILSIGSANLNTRSLYLDYELNAIVYDEILCKDMIEVFENYIKKSKKVTLDDYENLNPIEKIKLLIGRLISPLA